MAFHGLVCLLNLVALPTIVQSQGAGNLAIYTSDTVPKLTTQSVTNEKNYSAPYFPLLGFKQYVHNPILKPSPNTSWESSYVFNPATIVVDDKVWMLYRAQNKSLVSTVGLAWSDDGFNFTRYTKPVFYPTEAYERNGTEDPRIIRVDGTFYLTYTAYNGSLAQLCIATSTDLLHWQKHGPILPDCTDVNYLWDIPINAYTSRAHWSKSGAIVAEKINGLYQIQWGDNWLMSANSTDLIHWNYTQNDIPFSQKLNIWEQGLMESGPPPVKTRDGMWLKFYNGVALGPGGYAFGAYNTGQMLIDMENQPRGPPVARIETPVLQPKSAREVKGQVDNVLFAEGLVQFRGMWLLYYGEGDNYVGVATAPVQP